MNPVNLEIGFTPVDSLYFKGSRPHAAAGASSLPSDFPPAAATFTGALRTRLGDALQADWNAMTATAPDGQPLDLTTLLGDATHTGLLDFSSPYLVKNGKRLYPAPAVVLRDNHNLVKLRPGAPVRCDLGRVRLPELPAGTVAAKPLENTWMTERGMQAFLAGRLPDTTDLVGLGDLVSFESRLGIGRNVAMGTVESGLLYQTEHLRLNADTGFGIQIRLPADLALALTDSILANPLHRFGGEGRMVELSVNKRTVDSALQAPGQINMLVLVTDMLPDSMPQAALLPGFTRACHDGIDCWEGEINGIGLRITTVVAGKAVTAGGWDIRNNAPKPVRNLVPAGTCFFVEPLHKGTSLASLQGVHVGRSTLAGAGTLLCATA